MDVEQYLTEIVEPTIAECEASPTSRRHAFLACVALFHTLDYLQLAVGSANLRKSFRDQSVDFADVDRIAHAFKHVSTGHPASANNQPLKSDDVITRPPAVWGVAVWDLSRWDDEKGGVTLNEDREFDLLATLQRALAFVRAQIKG
jgi:hypothetical protein